MTRHRGNRKAAADDLGITTRSLNRRLELLRARNAAQSTWELAVMYGREDIQTMAWPLSMVAPQD